MCKSCGNFFQCVKKKTIRSFMENKNISKHYGFNFWSKICSYTFTAIKTSFTSIWLQNVNILFTSGKCIVKHKQLKLQSTTLQKMSNVAIWLSKVSLDFGKIQGEKITITLLAITPIMCHRFAISRQSYIIRQWKLIYLMNDNLVLLLLLPSIL